MNDEQKQELVALVLWIQTFPSFDLKLIDGYDGIIDAESLVGSLDQQNASRAIMKVAEELCDTKIDEENDGGQSSNRSYDNSSTEQIWTSLLIMTSTRARPILKDSGGSGSISDCGSTMTNDTNGSGTTMTTNTTATTTTTTQGCVGEYGGMMSPARLKLYVLSNLLDCAVTTPNMDRRKEYVNRIVRFPNAVQRRLMSLIDRRTPGNKKRSSRSRSRGRSKGRKSSSATTRPSTPKSTDNSNRSSQYQLGVQTAQHGMAPGSTTPTRMKSSPVTPSGHRSNASRGGNLFCSDDGLSPTSNNYIGTHKSGDSTTPRASQSTTMRSSPRQPRTPSSRRYDTSSGYNRNASALAYNTSSTDATPDANQKQHRAVDDALLSPGTLESPNRIQSIVSDLNMKNEHYKQTIASYKVTEEKIQRRIEEVEAVHRTQMMKVEAAALDQKEMMEEQVKVLTKDLEQAHDRIKKDQQELQELQQARDEIDVMHYSREALQETSEKLRIYKEKVAEMNDVKEALEREQEAHGKSVDEIVKLQNELQALKPLKRQLEDYKNRAIEAEVKLVECQDYLKRLKQDASDQSAANQYLRKDAMLQKEQLEELQRRIQQDTQNPGSSSTTSGVGAGVSELNPDLQKELTRLRNENFQLRAFAEKRQDDSIQKLEEELQNSKSMCERFKQDYLNTRHSLGETDASLTQEKANTARLSEEVEEWKGNTAAAESTIQQLQEKLSETSVSLEQTSRTLSETESQKAALRNEVSSLQENVREVESISASRAEEIERLSQDLDTAMSGISTLEENERNLQAMLSNLEAQLSDVTKQREDVEQQLQHSQSTLSETEGELTELKRKQESLDNQCKKLQTDRSKLHDLLEQERKSKQEAMEESHRSLEATREVLEAKRQKDVEELQSNMNRLLDDERRAKRMKDEESQKKLEMMDSRWQQEYQDLQDRSTSALKHARQEHQERINSLKQEYELQIEKTRDEAGDQRTQLVQKGKAMVMDIKSKAKKEMQIIYDECQELKGRLDDLEQKKLLSDKLFKEKIVSLQKERDAATASTQKSRGENMELQERYRSSQQEKLKLEGDIDRYKRQLNSKNGADGKTTSQQLEKIQKEFNTILEENRGLKEKIARSQNGGMETLTLGTVEPISEAHSTDMSTIGSGSYSRGGVSRAVLTEIRREHEETIGKLEDEKRELIMKNSVAHTDVQKAEQRAWEQEKKNDRLKGEIQSLRLTVERMKQSQNDGSGLKNGQTGGNISSQVSTDGSKELSFYSADEEERSPLPLRQPPTSGPLTMTTTSSRQIEATTFIRSTSPAVSPVPRSKRSPIIDRKMNAKAELETVLQARFQSLTSGQRFSLGSMKSTTTPSPSLSSSFQRNSNNTSSGSRLGGGSGGFGSPFLPPTIETAEETTSTTTPTKTMTATTTTMTMPSNASLSSNDTTGTTTKKGNGAVLSPTRKHEQTANRFFSNNSSNNNVSAATTTTTTTSNNKKQVSLPSPSSLKLFSGSPKASGVNTNPNPPNSNRNNVDNHIFRSKLEYNRHDPAGAPIFDTPNLFGGSLKHTGRQYQSSSTVSAQRNSRDDDDRDDRNDPSDYACGSSDDGINGEQQSSMVNASSSPSSSCPLALGEQQQQQHQIVQHQYSNMQQYQEQDQREPQTQQQQREEPQLLLAHLMNDDDNNDNLQQQQQQQQQQCQQS